jgi:hypothetical protein
VLLATLTLPSALAAQSTYAGSRYLGEGPHWSTNPPPLVHSAQETTAMLFGGSLTDCVVSTPGTDPALIDLLAHVDGCGDHDYSPKVSQSYSYSPCADGRYWDGPSCDTSHPDRGTANHDPAYSAYVNGAPDPTNINYAFRVAGATTVPEPITLLLPAPGLFGVEYGRSRRRKRERV